MNNSPSKELNLKSELKEPSSPTSSSFSTDLQDTTHTTDNHRSPTARSFFSAIKQGIRRSRSPSPAAHSSNSRATTPTPAEPPSPRPTTPSSPQSPDTSMASGSMYSTNQRSISTYTTSSTSSSVMATAPTPKRTSSSQSDFERLAYGRHSSEWLFGTSSVRNTIKKVVGKKPHD